MCSVCLLQFAEFNLNPADYECTTYDEDALGHIYSYARGVVPLQAELSSHLVRSKPKLHHHPNGEITHCGSSWNCSRATNEGPMDPFSLSLKLDICRET